MNKNFHFNFNIFFLIILVARSYFTNLAVFVSNIILPMLIFFILSLIIDRVEQRAGLAVGVAASGIISIGCLSFAVNFFEWRNSVIYKKAKISLISETQFFIAFILFYFLLSLVVFWFLIGFALFYEKIRYLIDNDREEFVRDQIDSISAINWMWIFINLALLSLVSILIGCFVGLISDTANSALGIGLVFYIVGSFITSCFVPLALTADVEFFRIGGNAIPIYSSIHSIQVAWLENIKHPSIYNLDEIMFAKVDESGFFFAVDSNVEVDEEYKIVFSQFSNLGPYWTHILTSIGWTAFLVLIIIGVNKWKLTRR